MSDFSEWIDDALGAIRNSDDQMSIEVINACGTGCATRSGADEALRKLGERVSECHTRSGYVAFMKEMFPFSIEEAEDGIILHLGKAECTCPISKGISRNADMLCECTRSHERYTWSLFFGRPVEVEIEESILRGGDDCVIRIIVPEDLRWNPWRLSP